MASYCSTSDLQEDDQVMLQDGWISSCINDSDVVGMRRSLAKGEAALCVAILQKGRLCCAQWLQKGLAKGEGIVHGYKRVLQKGKLRYAWITAIDNHGSCKRANNSYHDSCKLLSGSGESRVVISKHLFWNSSHRADSVLQHDSSAVSQVDNWLQLSLWCPVTVEKTYDVCPLPGLKGPGTFTQVTGRSPQKPLT